jgi:hypothetical protein
MQLANLRQPAIAFIFFETLLSLLAVDPIPMDDFYDENLQLDDTGPYTSQFEFLGFETFYALKNLGSLVLLILGSIAWTILVSPLLLCENKKVKDFAKSQHEGVYWNGIILFAYETYILFAMAGAIGTQYITFDTYGNTINFVVSALFWAIAIVLPLFIAVYYTKNFHLAWPIDERFYRKSGQILEELDLKRLGKRVVWHLVVHLVRVLTLVLTLMYLPDYPAIQIMIFCY